ncbi:MAG: hypothetical protein JNN15_05560 [Blastocatellia bacterium]|nr:hypothetical protein [Blastocatellia bacterium]
MSVNLDEKFRSLAVQFKQLHHAQEVLSKLGHMPTGLSPIETKIFSALKTLKPMIAEANPLALTAKITAIETQLKEYSDWIDQSNATLTPYDIRQYIKQQILEQTDFKHLAKYLVTKKSSSSDERGKIELVISELFRHSNSEEREELLAELFPEPPNLTAIAEKSITEISKLTSHIESIQEFPELIDGDFVTASRRLKLTLADAIWHPKALSYVVNLNFVLETAFSKLFAKERQFIAEACHTLKINGINYIGKLGESGVLKVEAAARLSERADGLLDQNYQTNVQHLQQLAKISHWLRQALETLAQQNRPTQNQQSKDQKVKQQIKSPNAQRDSVISPISTVIDYPDIEAMEKQLDNRIEEMARILKSRARRSGMEVLQLKRTVLLLAAWEIEAMLSLATDVNSNNRKTCFDRLRRAIALIAEMQESSAVMGEGRRYLSSNYHYSLPATVYFLEQAKREQGELETLSQTIRRKGEIEMAINLLATRNKLKEACQKMLGQLKDSGLDVD